MKILALETNSLVDAYKALNEITELGHTPLEFSPHAEGVRVLFQANPTKNLPANIQLKSFELSENLIKAYLGLGGTKLQEKMLVVEDASLWKLFELAQKLESLGASIIELRSFKSNSKFNHMIATFNMNSEILKAVEGFKSVVMNSNSPALKDFLGFTTA